jgi:flavin reductase (DIM6/NTAB) family NADH-FMN oxidoreductase RutF
MFYDARIKGSHGLPHDPFKALVAPRPIGWISTIDTDGQVNLAPYSFFNAVCYEPNIVLFSASGLPDDPMKHTRRNAEETGEFVCNMVSHDLRLQMRDSAEYVARGVDEMALVGLTPEPSELVKPPRVKEAPAHLECRYLQTVVLESNEPYHTHGVVFGEVVGIHIKDEYIVDGLVDVLRYRPVARMGYLDYTTVESSYSMPMPEKGT